MEDARPTAAQAVIVRWPLSDSEYGELEEREAVLAFEHRLSQMLDERGLGYVDGHEFGGGFAAVYIYGSSADRLAAAAIAALDPGDVPPGSTLTKRYGPPGSPAVTSALS
jgi:hypothetical protein